MELIPTSTIQASDTVAHNETYFTANYDPFGFNQEWKEASTKPIFSKVLGTFEKMNTAAVSQGFQRKPKTPKNVSVADICVQAMISSWWEDIMAAHRVVDTLGFSDARDIPSMQEIFRGYSDGKNNYAISTAFNISWFAQLCSKYDSNGFHGLADKFVDFARIEAGAYTFDAVLENVKHSEWNGIALDFVRGINKKSWVEFDFKNGCTRWHAPDMYMPSEANNGNPCVRLSTQLKKDDPFATRNKLSFMVPVGYRGMWFPLINVTKIELDYGKYTDETPNLEMYQARTNTGEVLPSLEKLI